MYLAFRRRKAVEDLSWRSVAMAAALHANSAFYKTENGPRIREEMIQTFDEKVKEITVRIYDSRTDEEIAAAEQEDPFLAAVDLSQQIVESEQQKQEQMERGERIVVANQE